MHLESTNAKQVAAAVFLLTKNEALMLHSVACPDHDHTYKLGADKPLAEKFIKHQIKYLRQEQHYNLSRINVFRKYPVVEGHSSSEATLFYCLLVVECIETEIRELREALRRVKAM